MRATTLMLSLILAAAVAGVGCGDDGNPAPPDSGMADTGVGDTSPADTGGGDTGGGDTGVADTGMDAGTCEGDGGCWSCEPTEPEHILNACTDSECVAFPITQDRLPLLNDDGTLPSLP